MECKECKQLHILIAKQAEEILSLRKRTMGVYQDLQKGKTIERDDNDVLQYKIDGIKAELNGLRQTIETHYKLGGLNEQVRINTSGVKISQKSVQ